MSSPNFNFKLDIRCDEIEDGKFSMNGDDSDMAEQEVKAEA